MKRIVDYFGDSYAFAYISPVVFSRATARVA
jgi:hypothetical protein